MIVQIEGGTRAGERAQPTNLLCKNQTVQHWLSYASAHDTDVRESGERPAATPIKASSLHKKHE